MQAAFHNDNSVLILSHSVMPEMDRVQRLAAYVKRFHIPAGNWHLITGNKESIYSLARKSYFADEETGFDKNS